MAFDKANPSEIKQLLASIVSEVELDFDHKRMKNGRHRNTFTDGKIYLRPNADGGEGFQDKDSSPLGTTGTMLRTRQTWWHRGFRKIIGATRRHYFTSLSRLSTASVAAS